MTYNDGSMYHGEWDEDKRHGQGILLNVNGDRYEGLWINDKKSGIHFHFISSLPFMIGPGKFIFKNQRQCYTGEWLDGLPKYGTLVDLPPFERKYLIPSVKIKLHCNFFIF